MEEVEVSAVYGKVEVQRYLVPVQGGLVSGVHFQPMIITLTGVSRVR